MLIHQMDVVTAFLNGKLEEEAARWVCPSWKGTPYLQTAKIFVWAEQHFKNLWNRFISSKAQQTHVFMLELYM